jgi:hypothetical protein
MHDEVVDVLFDVGSIESVDDQDQPRFVVSELTLEEIHQFLGVFHFGCLGNVRDQVGESEASADSLHHVISSGTTVAQIDDGHLDVAVLNRVVDERDAERLARAPFRLTEFARCGVPVSNDENGISVVDEHPYMGTKVRPIDQRALLGSHQYHVVGIVGIPSGGLSRKAQLGEPFRQRSITGVFDDGLEQAPELPFPVRIPDDVVPHVARLAAIEFHQANQPGVAEVPFRGIFGSEVLREHHNELLTLRGVPCGVVEPTPHLTVPMAPETVTADRTT